MLGSATAEWLGNMSNPSNEAGRRKGQRIAAGQAASGAGGRPNDRQSLARVSTPAVPSDDREEEAFLRACVQEMVGRDQSALGRLYDATCARVHGVVLRIVRRADLAEEVLADVYHQAWRDCQRYDAGRGKVIAWLLIIGRTRALDALRRADEAFSHPAPHDLVAPEALLSGDDDPLNLLDTARGNDGLNAALGALSALQRQLIALAFYKGLSHAEIAAHTRLPLGSVKTHIRKALLQLRDALAEGERAT